MIDTTKAVDLTKGEQHKPEYLAINPNNKILQMERVGNRPAVQRGMKMPDLQR